MILEPWPHIVIDDFLKPIDLLNLQMQCAMWEADDIQPKLKAGGAPKGHYRFKFKTDPLKDYDIPQYFDQFKQQRPYRELGKLIQLIKTCEDCKYPIHDDAPHKIFALMIYLAPQENIGTELYAGSDLVKLIEWKPNRAVIFCPLTDVTYHAYGSSSDRFTLMFNYVDTSTNPNDTIPL